MTSKTKFLKPFLILLAFALCFTSISVVSATEIESDAGVAPVETVETLTTRSITQEVSPTGAESTTFNTLEEVGAYIREQMVNRTVSFEVSLVLSYDEYLDGGWGTDGNKYFMDEALKHTSNGNEGDYIAYAFSRYTVGRNATYNSQTGKFTLTHTYTFTYYNSSQEEAYVTSQIPVILKEAGVTSYMDNFAKSKLIAQWMIDNVACTDIPSSESSYKYSPYGAVKNGRAVCQGYSLLAYRLLMEAGVDCRMITGTVNGGNHAWILAQMDNGLYYNMDIMYEDTYAPVATAAPFKYLYKGSNNFGYFANHTYIRGNTTDFNCSLFDYDTAEFDATYPTDTDDYGVAFGEAVTPNPPIALPDDYELDLDLSVAMSGGGDIILNITPVGGSGLIDFPVLIDGENHSRFKYSTQIILQESYRGGQRLMIDPQFHQSSDENTFSFLLPFNTKIRTIITITDYGVKEPQTIEKQFIFTTPANPKSDVLDARITEIIDLCADYSTEYDKALFLHDWIIKNSTVDTEETRVGAEGVLLRGIGNMESYTRAYQMLLDACGIQSHIVLGGTNTVSNLDNIWLCVSLDGEWTFIDIFKNATAPINDNLNRHLYFGINKDMMSSVRDSYYISEEFTGATTAFANTKYLQNNYVLRSGQLNELAKPYLTKIEAMLNGEEATLSIPVTKHAVEDVYTLYYPALADNISNMDFRQDVKVTYNATAKTMDVVIAKVDHTGHSTVVQNAIKATCTEPGWTGDVYCNNCQILISESEEIEPLGHDWDYYHKCKTCGKFDTTPGNLIYYGAKDDPVRAEYKIVDDNSVQYYKCKAVDGMTDVKVADYIKIGGKVYYVTSMNPNCFADKPGLTSVHVGENITSIGSGVFKDQTELVKVTGFNKVKEIYSKAFYNCTKLQQVGDIKNVVNLPLVTELRAETFFKCRAITTIYGMNKVFSIGDRAFYGCNQLTQIGNAEKCLTLPSITKIGKEAFRYCTGIKTIYSYSTQLITIGIGAFQDCSNLYSIKISSDKLTTVSSDAFKGIASKATFLVHTQNLNTYAALFSNAAGFKSTMTLKGY